MRTLCLRSLCCLLTLPLCAMAAPNFVSAVKPVLQARCVKCHGTDKQKGGIDFSPLLDEAAALKQRKLWRGVLQQIEAGEMPPEGEKALTAEEKQAVVGWIKQVTRIPTEARLRDPGPPPLRRLTRAEYTRTVRDLLGIDLDAAEAVGIPADGGVGFENLAAALTLPPALLEKYFAAADLVLDRLFQTTDGGSAPAKLDAAARKRAEAAYTALFFVKPDREVSPRQAARQIIERLAQRAYRRPVRAAEIDRLLKLYDRGDKHEQGVRLMVKAILVSPNFLFRVELERADATAPYRVSDQELAVRLSYFLWASQPDEELARLASEKKLGDNAVLDKQIRRLLSDRRAAALTDLFAVQWLQLNKLASARPSTEFFPTFTPKLRQAMFDETTRFFEGLRTEDRSVLELLDADYTYLNQDLARHYGITDVTGPEMRKVTLRPESHRGGLIGMGSLLALTSHTSRTSPTLRGKWVLDVILGAPPPPPPPDVSMIKEERDPKKTPRTFREQLAQHARDTSCSGCHKKMDPLGFALDNYDAVGAWRTSLGGQKLDTSAQLPSGEKFDGAEELKQILLKRKGEFVRNLVEQMLSYALGRELTVHDDPVVDEIYRALEKDQYRFSTLVVEIARSYPFLYRRNAEATRD